MPSEFHLRKALKVRILGLAAVDRARRRQQSRQVWLKEGDANTRFFHVKINARRRRNFVHQFSSARGIHVTHEDKAQALHEHFADALGTTASRQCSISWQGLGMPSLPAAGIDNPFSLAEIWDAVKVSSAEKAPSPDGFTGTFYRKCWATIKWDILAAFNHLFRLAGGNFAALNLAFICLLPKKDQTPSVNDFRPISLIHSFAKLFSKVLARRITPLMGGLISHAQSEGGADERRVPVAGYSRAAPAAALLRFGCGRKVRRPPRGAKLGMRGRRRRVSRGDADERREGWEEEELDQEIPTEGVDGGAIL
ncbi:hypothetical protein ACQ4PT_031868 [Festuca glaucescens]